MPRTLALAALVLALFAPLACREVPPPEAADPTAAAIATEPDPAYLAEMEAWHARREESLRKEDGWLTLAGLYWLEEGEWTFGSAADNDLVFPDHAPGRIGVLRRDGETVTVEVEPGLGLTADGEPVTTMTLAADATGEPTMLELGSFSFFLIERAGRYGIRLRDRESPVLAGFEGIEHFPVDPAWRMEARFEPYDPPKAVRIPNIIGTEFDDSSPGAVVITVGGKSHRLEPVGEPGEPMFLVFGDTTNGEETYGGGRFLELPAPENGTVTVDFNQAYNPPCVFTPYATCPLPPRQNRLPIPIPAGEKNWGHAAH